MKYVLDSYAFFVLFNEEKGHEIVKNILKKAKQKKATIYLNIMQYGEILYHIEREYGVKVKETIKSNLEQLTIELVEVNKDMVELAASYKVKGRISYADCFVLATAQKHNATILTGDKEFKPYEQKVRIQWL